MIRFKSPHHFFSELKRDNSGLALIEFAMALPLWLILALGGLEMANLATAHMRVSQIAMTVADNASRVEPTIDESDIYEIFAGAEEMGGPLNFEANGRIVLSSLQHNEQSDEDEGQMINWQRCYGDLAEVSAYGTEDAGRFDDSLANGMGSAPNTIAAAPSTAVMFVEVFYDYQQLIPGKLFSRKIRYETAFNVRSRDVYDISNSSSPVLAEKTCS